MFAVINLGLKSIRLCLLDDEAHILFKKSYPLHSVIFGDGVEQSGEEWWRLARQLFDDARTAGHALAKVRGVTVAASSSCLVCVTEEGRQIRPVIMVSDRRHSGGSAGPVLVQRIKWLEQSEPETYRNTAYFLSPNDYLVYLLTGKAVTDVLNAEKSGFNIVTGKYEGLPERDVRRLPAVAQIGTVVASLRPQVAAELGLSADAEVWLSSYDAIVSVVGSGAVADGDLCDVSGTVTSMRMVSSSAAPHPTGAVASQRMDVLGCNYIGGSTNLGGGLIEWLKTTFYDPHGPVYESIEADVESVKPGESSLIFLPYLLGERAPIWDSDARGVFFGLERSHGRKHFARATMEGAAFIGRSLMDEIVRVHGSEPARIRLSGGLSRLAMANRIKADVYGAAIEVVSEFESTVVGAYLLAFGSLIWKNDKLLQSVRSRVRVREIILPDPEACAIYREKYAIFQEVYGALKPHFGRLRHVERSAVKSEDGFLENL